MSIKIRPDTRVFAFVQPNRTVWVAGTDKGIAQFRSSEYNTSGDSGWDITNQLGQDSIIAANRVSNWERIRRFGREYNFVACG